MTAFANSRLVTRILACAAASVVGALALYFSITSALLALSLTRPFVFWDEWVFFGWYLTYLDGNLSFRSFFDLWGDHRLFTTRVVLFLDAFYFDLKGQMPIVVMYVTFLLIAALIAKLAFEAERGLVRIVGFAAALGLTWSITQFENLSFPFQVCHAFVHLFALVTFMCLARALMDESRYRILWLAAACVADFLTIYTLGPGMLIVLPAIAIAIWLRKLDRFFWAFIVFHATVLAVYFFDYVVPQYGPVPGGKSFAYIEFFGNFLGTPFRGWHSYQFVIGMISAIVFLASAGILSFVALIRKTPVDRAATVILSLAAFAFLQALAAAYGRVHAGIAPRYATPAVILVACLLAFFWRVARRRGITGDLLRAGLLLLTAIALLGTNLAYYETEWRLHIATRDKAAFAFVNGIFPEAQVEAVGPSPYLPYMKRMATLGLAQFSASAHAYQAPLNTLAGLDFDILPACRYGIESVANDNPEWSRIEGWALHPTEARPAEWILAFSRSRRLVGYTRPLVWRADAARVLTTPYVGFELYLNGSAIGPNRAGPIQLVATLRPSVDGKSPRACTISITLPESEMR